MWQGAEGGLLPTASRKLGPQSCNNPSESESSSSPVESSDENMTWILAL